MSLHIQIRELARKGFIKPSLADEMEKIPHEKLFRIVSALFTDILFLNEEDIRYLIEAIDNDYEFEKRLKFLVRKFTVPSIKVHFGNIVWATKRFFVAFQKFKNYAPQEDVEELLEMLDIKVFRPLYKLLQDSHNQKM